MARLIDSGACCEHQHRTSSQHQQLCPRPVYWAAGKHTEVGAPPSRASIDSSRSGVSADMGSHESPLEPVCAARGPRRSLDAARRPPPAKETSSSKPQTSIKQRLRQRRFSYAIGDSIPLRTIKECSRQEDAVVLLDQPPAVQNSKGLDLDSSSVVQASAASSSSSSSCSSYCDSWRNPQAPPSSTCSVASSIHISSRHPVLSVPHQDQQQHLAVHGAMPSLTHTQAGVLALLQHSVAAPHTQQHHTQHDLLMAHHYQQQQHRQRGQPRRQSAAVRPHDQVGPHTLTGLNQEQIWRYLQQQRCEQLEQQERWRAQAQRLQQEEADELRYWQQQEHEWEALLQRLHELSYSSAGAAGVTNSRDKDGDEGMQDNLEHWWVGQHRDALLVLQQIEAELHEIEATHDRLAAARAIAAPGSAAALACESALLQHQAVLQQALAARADIAAAVSEAAAALGADCREYVQQEEHPAYDGAEGDSVYEEGARFDFSWEGFEDEHLHPSDTEALPHPQALLQHFGHYAII